MVAYTKPQHRRKEESEQLRGDVEGLLNECKTTRFTITMKHEACSPIDIISVVIL